MRVCVRETERETEREKLSARKCLEAFEMEKMPNHRIEEVDEEEEEEKVNAAAF